MTKIILSANTDWYLYNFRLALAHRIMSYGWDLLLVSPDGTFAHSLVEAGFSWKSLNMVRGLKNPFNEISTIRSFLKLYRSWKPDLVHHFTIKPIILGSLATRFSGLPSTVNSVTGLGYPYVNAEKKATVIRTLLKPLYRLALSAPSSTAVFHNSGDREFFISEGIVLRGDTLVIPGSGVDPDEFQPHEEPPGKPIVLLASRMLWDKGVGEFEEAARILNKRGVIAQFDLAGDSDSGYPDAVPETTLNRWNEEGIVRWIGRRNDMPQLMKQVHIVALPSYGEGLPRVLLEASAAGRPVVASDVPGCRAVVRNGETGLLIPPRDAGALADALETLIVDANLRKRMGMAGRAWVMERFTQEQINDQIIDLYVSKLGIKHS